MGNCSIGLTAASLRTNLASFACLLKQRNTTFHCGNRTVEYVCPVHVLFLKGVQVLWKKLRLVKCAFSTMSPRMAGQKKTFFLGPLFWHLLGPDDVFFSLFIFF